jgi:hypothetical protein
VTFDDENGLPPGLLGEMMGDVVRNNKAKGWYDEERTWGDEIALLHSEVSEALEAFRDYGLNSFHEHKQHGICATDAPCNYPGDEALPKPQGVGSELADALIRLLDTCARYEITLLDYEGKERNDFLSFGAALAYLHFRISQFMMHVESRFTYANDLYRVLRDISVTYGLRLDEEYERKMAYNLTRPHRHGGRAL